jgi:hypothetical protein
MKTWSRKINDRRFQPGRLPVCKVIAIGFAVSWVAVLVPLNPLLGQTTVTQLVAGPRAAIGLSDSSAQLVQTSDTAWTLTKIGSVNRAEVVHERYEARRSNPVVLAIG